jgi:hypothetical protein
MDARRWMWIVWPAFLAAAIMEMVVLPLWTRWMCTGWAPPGLVAPGHLYGRFFAFWVVTLIGGAMTVMLGRSVSDLNGGIVSEPLPVIRPDKKARCPRALS